MSDSKEFMKPAEDDGINWDDDEPKKPVEPAIDEPVYDKFILANFKWQECRTDPVNFKPYSPTILPENIWIQIAIPTALTVSYELIDGSENIASSCVLTLEGFTYVQNAIKKAIEKNYHQ